MLLVVHLIQTVWRVPLEHALLLFFCFYCCGKRDLSVAAAAAKNWKFEAAFLCFLRHREWFLSSCCLQQKGPRRGFMRLCLLTCQSQWKPLPAKLRTKHISHHSSWWMTDFCVKKMLFFLTFCTKALDESTKTCQASCRCAESVISTQLYFFLLYESLYVKVFFKPKSWLLRQVKQSRIIRVKCHLIEMLLRNLCLNFLEHISNYLSLLFLLFSVMLFFCIFVKTRSTKCSFSTSSNNSSFYSLVKAVNLMLTFSYFQSFF